MGPRARKALERQQAHHERRIAEADTPTGKMLAAFLYFQAESKRGGPDALAADTEAILALAANRRRANLKATSTEAKEKAA